MVGGWVGGVENCIRVFAYLYIHVTFSNYTQDEIKIKANLSQNWSLSLGLAELGNMRGIDFDSLVSLYSVRTFKPQTPSYDPV